MKVWYFSGHSDWFKDEYTTLLKPIRAQPWDFAGATREGILSSTAKISARAVRSHLPLSGESLTENRKPRIAESRDDRQRKTESRWHCLSLCHPAVPRGQINFWTPQLPEHSYSLLKPVGLVLLLLFFPVTYSCSIPVCYSMASQGDICAILSLEIIYLKTYTQQTSKPRML